MSGRVPVWPLAVRVAHWALAASVITCLVLHEGGPVHEALGYAALAVALGRTVAGFAVRNPLLRFGGFVTGASATLAYLRALSAGREPHHLGHNPLGGWMIVALLLAAVTAGVSGALYTTDRFWGDELVYGIHRVAGWSFAVLAPLHVAGVAFTSWRQRENLVAAMFSGRKKAPPAGS